MSKYTAGIVAFIAGVIAAICLAALLTGEKECEPVIPPSYTEHDYVRETLKVKYTLSEPEADVYAYQFLKYQKEFKLDWAWFAVTAYIESGYDPTACSERKACNLFQLKDSTLMDICRKNKIPYTPNKTIWNDVINIYAGAYYLAQGYQKGKEEGMIKGYIAGHGFRKHKPGTQTFATIEEYYDKVRAEHTALRLIYRGLKDSMAVKK